MTVVDHNKQHLSFKAEMKRSLFAVMIFHAALSKGGNCPCNVVRPPDFNTFGYGLFIPSENQYTLDFDQSTRIEIGAPTDNTFFDIFVEGSSTYTCAGSSCPVTELHELLTDDTMIGTTAFGDLKYNGTCFYDYSYYAEVPRHIMTAMCVFNYIDYSPVGYSESYWNMYLDQIGS